MLIASVGQPWDNVYSHVLSKFKRNREADRLTLHAIDRYVQLNCVEVARGESRVILDSERHPLLPGDLYVHPRTKLLQRVPKKSRTKTKKADRTKLHVDGRDYRKVNNVWYEITLEPLLPVGVQYPRVTDVLVEYERKIKAAEIGAHPSQIAGSESLTRWDFLDRYGSFSYAASKRQLGRRELDSIIYPRVTQ
jgi:hypothetical protein